MKNAYFRGFNWIKKHPWWTFLIFLVTVISLMILPKRITSAIQGPEAKYQTVKVKKGDLFQTVSASGLIQSENQAELKFQTSGLLTWVGVKEGDEVKKWQAIASLDKRQLHKAIEKDLNDYLNERWDFEQARADYGVKGEPLEKYLLSDAAKRILEKSQFDLNNAVIDVEVSDITERLSTITSPIDGIVTHIDCPLSGVNITPATATFIIADPKKMEFIANVDEGDIRWVRLGQKVKIVLDAYPDEEFEALVNQIAFSSVTTKGGGTAYQVKISLGASSEQKFKVGMNGDAEIIIDSRQEVIYLPQETVKSKNGQKFVQVIAGKQIKEVEVKTGLETESELEILSGLEEGQKVIIGEKKS